MMHFSEKLERPSHGIKFRIGAFCAGIAGLLLLGGSALAQEKLGSAQAGPEVASIKESVASDSVELSAGRIDELFKFAHMHHPEITPLLRSLQKKRPNKFKQVMRRLDRDVRNLAQVKERSPEAYQMDLKAWINRSHIRLYSAQFKVAADDKTADAIRMKIQQLLEENIDAKISRQERYLAKAQARVEWLQESLAELKTGREAWIEKRIKSATKKWVNPKKNPGMSDGKKASRKAGEAANPPKNGP